MADQRGTLETLITGLAQVFEPLFVGMQPGEVRRLLAELGYFISAPQEAAILPTTTDVANKLRSLFEIVSEFDRCIGEREHCPDRAERDRRGIEAKAGRRQPH